MTPEKCQEWLNEVCYIDAVMWEQIKQVLTQDQIMELINQKTDEFIKYSGLELFNIEKLDFDLVDVIYGEGDFNELLQTRMSIDELKEIYQTILEKKFPDYEEHWDGMVKILGQEHIVQFVNQRKDVFMKHYEIPDAIETLDFSMINMCHEYESFSETPHAHQAEIFKKADWDLADVFDHYDDVLDACYVGIHMGHSPCYTATTMYDYESDNCTEGDTGYYIQWCQKLCDYQIAINKSKPDKWTLLKFRHWAQVNPTKLQFLKQASNTNTQQLLQLIEGLAKCPIRPLMLIYQYY